MGLPNVGAPRPLRIGRYRTKGDGAGCEITPEKSRILNGNNQYREILQVHEADLTDSRFSDAKLTNVRFDDVNLQGSTFTNANLAGVRFRDVNLASATIEDANLTGMSINEALVTELIGVNRVHDSLSRSAGSPDPNTGQTGV